MAVDSIRTAVDFTQTVRANIECCIKSPALGRFRRGRWHRPMSLGRYKRQILGILLPG